MSTIQSFLPLIFLFAMLYFMILRPKQRDEKRRREMLSELKKGDKV
ncbi:MAG: preprotein translocase subunit YajC, partial [Eikenella corrodens]|nr:preprotein translocase subunit YajC [Eikenella corrodens]